MKVVTNNDESGKVVYNSEIIKDIVDCALNDIPEVVKYPAQSKQARGSVKIEQADEEMFIDIFVKLHYTASAREAASKIQNLVKTTLETMTEFKVSNVNVHVIDVEFEVD